MVSKFWALVVGALLLLSYPAIAGEGVDGAEGRLNIADVQLATAADEDLERLINTVLPLLEKLQPAGQQRGSVKISRHYGGVVTEYIDEYAKLRDAGVDVEVVDFCISACTLTLGLIESERLCAYPKAIFGFHSAWQQRSAMSPPEFAKEATRLIWNLYPEKVQEVLKARGWDGDGDVAHPEIIYVKASDLGVRACGA